jgi:PAS domain S-box-containing protein
LQQKFVVEVIMSVRQANKPNTETDTQEHKEPLMSELPSPSQQSQARKLSRYWQIPYYWLITHTFEPQWLPKSLRHPLIGYLVAILLASVTTFLTLQLVQIYPSFAFAGLLEVLAIALIALTWGVGPSLLATLLGAILLNFCVLPSYFYRSLNDTASLVETALFLLVGFTISIVASQSERARRNAAELSASLATERARLEAVIETVPDAVSIHDIEGRPIRLNQQGRQNAGTRGGETLSEAQHAYNVRTPDGKPLPLEEFPVVRALHGETVSCTEMRIATPQGQDQYISASAAPLHDLSGNIEGAILISHDVTALRTSEREAAARATELEAIFEAMTDSIFVFNNQAQLLRMNRAAYRLFDLDESLPLEHFSRILYQHRYNFAPFDEQGRPLPQDQWPLYRILNGEVFTSTNAVDIIARNRNGHTLLLSISGAPLYDKENHIIGAVCICQNITERRQLEKRTQETLNALLAMAEALVLIPDSNITTGQLPAASEGVEATSVNKVARRMAELTGKVLGCERVSITAVEPDTHELRSIAVVGLAPEQEQLWMKRAPGYKLSDLFDHSSHTPSLSTGEAFVMDMTQPPFNTIPNPYNISKMLITPMNVGDQLVGILSLDHNGREHEYTTQEITLAKAVAKLAALVIERERLLRERAEARANELALREANRRMDEFLGMTSHELKTPLTSIKGNTQLAVRQLRKNMQTIQRMQDMFESTERQIKLLDRLVNDLLDISRSQTNQLELNLVPCDLTTIVREVITEQQHLWPNRTITLDPPDNTNAPIYADPDRINQVITNYLTNALKYSSEDRPVQVMLQPEKKGVRVLVKDQGPGLSPDEQARIWDRFHRAQGVEVLSTSQSSMVGLGLGLYISKTIIEQHHGSVGVESSPNSGSTFWFTLPLAETSAEP